MISKDYKQTLINHHKNNPNWGTTAGRWVKTVEKLTRDNFCFWGLDYGCGKGVLKDRYRGQTRWKEYDPGIEGKDKIEAVHGGYDIVTCIDVLEHIEPDNIGQTLEEVIGLANKIVFLVISTRPAIEKLEDGRNAHLIIEEPGWWVGLVQEISGVPASNLRWDKKEDEVTITIWK